MSGDVRTYCVLAEMLQRENSRAHSSSSHSPCGYGSTPTPSRKATLHPLGLRLAQPRGLVCHSNASSNLRQGQQLCWKRSEFNPPSFLLAVIPGTGGVGVCVWGGGVGLCPLQCSSALPPCRFFLSFRFQRRLWRQEKWKKRRTVIAELLAHLVKLGVIWGIIETGRGINHNDILLDTALVFYTLPYTGNWEVTGTLSLSVIHQHIRTHEQVRVHIHTLTHSQKSASQWITM